MATVGQVYYKVIIPSDGGEPISTGQDIYQDIVKAVGASKFTKLGVQAPPGTKMVFNEPDNPKEIMVGRTGIYELDEDISITSLRFVRPRRFEYKAEESEAIQQAGIKSMLEAEHARRDALADLNAGGEPTEEDPKDRIYWDQYEAIQNTYSQSYQPGLIEYHRGINGVYKLPNEEDINAPENYDEIYNVIIDFIYE